MSQNYYDTMLKDLIKINKDFERKYDQHIENIEATQRIVIENQGGIKSLVKMNYDAMIKNRNEILENRNIILNGIEDIQAKLISIEEKLTPT